MSKPRNKRSRESEYSTKWLELLDTVTNIIIIPILVLSVICSIVMINAKRSNNVPNLFGYSLVTILSGSMENSGFHEDDTVIVKDINTSEIEVGDIIAYYTYIESYTDIKSAAQTASAMEKTEVTEESYLKDGGKVPPDKSTVSSWKLQLNKIFSNLTYTATEASERAVRANKKITFHQVVDVVEYQNSRWFKTWGTSNLDSHGNPNYDSYWIKEDYIIGVYTNTSLVVRSFLGFASTNTGIIWMVEVPSGVQLILSTLELIEIIDMMGRVKHDQIKNGTYVDRSTYRQMLRERRKLLATGNIDVDTYRRFYPPYQNHEIKNNDRDRLKTTITANGPPVMQDASGAYAQSLGRGQPNDLTYGRNGPPWSDSGGGGPARNGPPWSDSGGGGPANGGPPWSDSGGGGPANGGPPWSDSGGGGPARNGPPWSDSGGGGPARNGPPWSDSGGGGPARNGPPWSDSGGGGPARNGPGKAYKQSFDKLDSERTKNLLNSRPKQVVNENESEDEISLFAKIVRSIKTKLAKTVNRFAVKLGINEVLLTSSEINELEDMYNWVGFCFVSKARISRKGYVVEPSRKNRIYLIDKKTMKQYSLEPLGTIYGVSCGLITSEKGLFKAIIRPEGVVFERIEIDSKYTVVKTMQDTFGNVYIGITNGPDEEEVRFTSDGKRVSLWNRNALLALGNDNRLYFVTMDDSFNIDKGKITDLKVINKEGSLVAVMPTENTKLVRFKDSYDRYGFVYYDGNFLCLDNGYKYFNLTTKETYSLPINCWQLSEDQLAIALNDGNLYKVKVQDVLNVFASGEGVNSIQDKQLLLRSVSRAQIKGDSLEFTSTDGVSRFVAPLTAEFLARAQIRLGSWPKH